MNDVKITPKQTDHIAKLANLTLNDEEKTKFARELTSILGYINKLTEVNTTGVEPTSQVTGLTNVWRSDKVKPSLSQEQALKNAKSTYNGYFKVKAVFENE